MMSKRCRGVTLIELLTVLGVVSLLAVLVLPSVKTLLTDRKSTNSATMVRNFLEAARARAVGSGLPVAVVFERLSSVPADLNADGLINENDFQGGRLISATATDPLPVGARSDTNFLPYNASIRMSMAEQPLPVTNAMLSGGVEIWARGPATWSNPYNPPVDIRPISNGGLLTPSEVEARNYFTIDGGATNQVLLAFFKAGNEVSFNKSTTKHMIVESKSDSPILWFTTLSSSGVMSNLEQALPSNEIVSNPKTLISSFTVFPKLRPINGQAIQLPKGTCVDLSLSGFSTKGNLALRDPSDPDFFRDARWRFSSAWLYGNPAFTSISFPMASAPNASEVRPIYVVFSPDGGLSRVYANSARSSVSVPVEIADDFFLHVGKIDQVIVPVFSNAISQNLTDPSTYIVRLSSKSGAISVAPATQGIPVTADVGAMLELSRQGTYGAPLSGQ